MSERVAACGAVGIVRLQVGRLKWGKWWACSACCLGLDMSVADRDVNMIMLFSVHSFMGVPLERGLIPQRVKQKCASSVAERCPIIDVRGQMWNSGSTPTTGFPSEVDMCFSPLSAG